ncbi:MAG: DUF4189 domain-containing protein [Rhodospirillales bacterium]|nr:DUF4189 domain-containing protein [Rhodospirillales bacterium]
MDAEASVHFNSADLESGNRAKGLSGGVGDGDGDWRVELSTALDIEPLAYIRTTDGFLTSMHDLVVEGESLHYHVPFFNPGSNRSQVSRLRLINPSDTGVRVTIYGLDDSGERSGDVDLTVPAGGARTVSAQELESGGRGLSGRLGDGAGKWHLFVSADRPIKLMSLLRSPTGNLTNLSTSTNAHRSRGARITLSAGGQHTCGIRDTGVACWGYDNHGQSTPPAGTFVSVSAGFEHTCGVRDTGAVACWGWDAEGQSTPPAGTFVSVSAGSAHTCGVRDTGAVACWGNDEDGESTAPAGTFVSVSAGNGHTCGIRDTGAVACWGNDEVGQSTAPAGTFVSVSASGFHTCGIRGTGAVACWGNDRFGQSTAPAGTFVSVSAGGGHTCGIRDTGAVACWGGYDNSAGESTPPAGTFVSVSAGGFHTCGIRNTGTVACWGADNFGQSTPPADDTVDLVVQRPLVSDNTPNVGASITLSATVRNQGNARSAATTLRYYRSPDTTISMSDTVVGSEPVGGLAASTDSRKSVNLNAPSTVGTYYYGACVDSVPRESNTTNNCSSGVRVTVSGLSGTFGAIATAAPMWPLHCSILNSGHALNFPDRNAAASAAESRCRATFPFLEGCRARTVFTRCGAVALGVSTNLGSNPNCGAYGGVGATRIAAEQDALSNCRADHSGALSSVCEIPQFLDSGTRFSYCNGEQ